MPTIYLSPSIQPYNKYLTEGDEQYWMNRIADDMVPMLEQNGINVVRNTPNTSLGQAIRESNAGNYDLHLALHSNAGPSNLAGKLRGPDVYYYPYSASGKRAAACRKPCVSRKSLCRSWRGCFWRCAPRCSFCAEAISPARCGIC